MKRTRVFLPVLAVCATYLRAVSPTRKRSTTQQVVEQAVKLEIL